MSSGLRTLMGQLMDPRRDLQSPEVRRVRHFTPPPQVDSGEPEGLTALQSRPESN